MALRLAEIHLPGHAADVLALLKDVEIVDVLASRRPDEVRVLVDTNKTEALLDRLDQRFGHREGFRVVLVRAHATLPRPAEPEETDAHDPAARPAETPPERVSRQEILTELEPGTRVNGVYVALVVLSATVAAVGLIQDNVAVIIGAMVIAPLLGPNMAAALATTLGDFELLRKALRTNAIGVVVAFVFAMALGVVARVDPTVPEIASRTNPHFLDVLLALASGAAGALAFTSGVSAGLVGVMVAVALMPPLVAAGLLVGTGAPGLAAKALLLLATNVICVNLAAVVTFLLQGVRPRTWWQADKARRAARRAVALWSTLLAVLAVLIYTTQG